MTNRAPSHQLNGDFLSAMTELLQERVTDSTPLREQHSHGEGISDAGLPDLVAFAHTNQEVAGVLALCNRFEVPVVPFGAGSSVEGQVAAVCGGVSLDLTGMNSILEISPESLDCRVQAGVTREQLNHDLRAQGLFFTVDPGADATIGGMAATRASGTNAFRYGTMRETVLGLTVVTAQGKIIRTGGRARKSSAGLDLTRLYIGSEGTLGVITEIQLRLQGVPEAILAASCQFDDFAAAVDTVSAALQSGLRLARIELIDEIQMKACIGYSKLAGFVEKPTLFLEFHGSPTSIAEDVINMQELAVSYGAHNFVQAERPEERNRLWTARHNAYHATKWLCPGKSNMGTDACVPISELAICLLETKKDILASGMVAPIVGHVGDGNFHLGIMHDPADSVETAKAEELAARVSERAIRLGGTCSGEHGIGLHKMRFMQSEHGDALDVMRMIKAALDPKNIMNPCKMLPLGEKI